MCGGHGSVFAATCLAMSRFLATAGQCSAALHTCVKGSAQAVKPDVCRCAAFKNKHISSSTVSTKTEAQKDHFIADSLRKRCIKKGFQGIHDRFQKDSRFRDSQLKIDRTEAKCIEMDEVAQKDFTYRMSSEECLRYKKDLVSLSQHNWTKCTDETPIRLHRSINKIAPSSP